MGIYNENWTTSKEEGGLHILTWDRAEIISIIFPLLLMITFQRLGIPVLQETIAPRCMATHFRNRSNTLRGGGALVSQQRLVDDKEVEGTADDGGEGAQPPTPPQIKVNTFFFK